MEVELALHFKNPSLLLISWNNVLEFKAKNCWISCFADFFCEREVAENLCRLFGIGLSTLTKERIKCIYFEFHPCMKQTIMSETIYTPLYYRQYISNWINSNKSSVQYLFNIGRLAFWLPLCCSVWYVEVMNNYSQSHRLSTVHSMFAKVHLGRPYRIVFTINVEVLLDLRDPIFHAKQTSHSLKRLKEKKSF